MNKTKPSIMKSFRSIFSRSVSVNIWACVLGWAALVFPQHLTAQQVKPVLETLDGHSHLSEFCVLNNNHLITIGNQKIIKWDIKTGLLLKKLIIDNAMSLKIVAGQKKILALGYNHFSIFNTQTFSFEADYDSIGDITSSVDGAWVFFNRVNLSSMVRDTTASYVYSCADGRIQKIRHFTFLLAINDHLVAGTIKDSIKLVNYRNDHLLYSAAENNNVYGYCSHVQINPNGQNILIEYAEKNILLDLSTGQHVVLPEHDYFDQHLSGNGKYLTYRTKWNCVLHDLESGKDLIQPADSVRDLVVSAKDQYVFTVPAHNQHGQITNLTSGEKVFEQTVSRYSAYSGFSHDDRYFLFDENDSYHLYTIVDGKFAFAMEFPYNMQYKSSIESFDLLPSKTLAVARPYNVYLWDVNTGKIRSEFTSSQLGLRTDRIKDINFINEDVFHLKTTSSSILFNLKDVKHPDVVTFPESKRFALTEKFNYLVVIDTTAENGVGKMTISAVDNLLKNNLRKIKPVYEGYVSVPEKNYFYYDIKLLEVRSYVIAVVHQTAFVIDKNGKLEKMIRVAPSVNNLVFTVSSDGKKFHYYHSYDSMGTLDINTMQVEFRKRTSYSWDPSQAVILEDSTATSAGTFPTYYKVLSPRFVGYIKESVLHFYNKEARKNAGRLFFINEDNWICHTDQGFIDASDPDELEGVHWLLPEYPDRAIPIRVYLKQFYKPGLLNQFFGNGLPLEAEPVTYQNILLPKVSFKKITPFRFKDILDVEISVQSVSDTVYFKNGDKIEQKIVYSGAQDLNLQRIDNKRENFADGFDSLIFADTSAGEKVFRLQVQIPGNGMTTLSSYAYNANNIRSNLVKQQIFLPYSTLYILGFGVDTYEDQRLNLQFADDDVLLMQNTLTGIFNNNQGFCYGCPRFNNMVRMNLNSQSDRKCTKQNIQQALLSLAGKNTGNKFNDLNRAWSEDVIFILLSGHGFLNESTNEFFFLPYDVGSNFTKENLDRAISSKELAKWIKYIDAKRIVLIIDACHSGASFTVPGFKSGSWNDKSFAELINNKNVHVIAASQPDNFALESDQIKQSLLTYALFKNGISDRLADDNPKDNQITLQEWLDYAVKRVPLLHEEILSGNVSALYTADNWKNFGPVTKEKQISKQQPTLFYNNKDEEFVIVDFSN
jgi:hypothetical protein